MTYWGSEHHDGSIRAPEASSTSFFRRSDGPTGRFAGVRRSILADELELIRSNLLVAVDPRSARSCDGDVLVNLRLHGPGHRRDFERLGFNLNGRLRRADAGCRQ